MDDAALFTPGTTVTRYEVLHGRVWLEHPVEVEADDGHVLAVVLSPGSPFTFPEHPFGTHPWSGHAQWSGTTVLQLIRERDAYAVWKFFEPDGTFRCWYVNFESPVVRRADGFETDDHGLDLVVHPDGRREWKDVDDLHRQRAEGRIVDGQVLAALAAAAGVVDLLDADDRWWAPWDGWTP